MPLTPGLLLLLLRVRVLQATFAAARGVPRHPNKPGVTARRVVPILPDVEAWPNKYVVVQFPEGDPAHDSRTLAKVRGVCLCFWRRTFLGESVRVAGGKPMQAATRGISAAAALAACVLPARAALYQNLLALGRPDCRCCFPAATADCDCRQAP